TWVCSVCGYVYDGENFAAEPDSYVCPICTVPKTMFEER
ncbi:MAG: rubredoxin/rubrerythrin, partial [Erysipelotrichia bacterium]|nr:rubredoxin/rubrerythrin [Erysipelotrichia bacterium]